MSEWLPDTIARLRVLWDEGHSTAEIGRRLGVSKNAVIGKAHRLDLPARPPCIDGYYAQKAAAARRETLTRKTAEWRERVRSLSHELGCRVAVARAMEIKLSTLIEQCSRMGIPLPPKKNPLKPGRKRKHLPPRCLLVATAAEIEREFFYGE